MGTTKITAKMDNIRMDRTEPAVPQLISRAGSFFRSISEMRLYRILNRSRMRRIQMLPMDGMSMMTATTAPRLKSGMPKSVKLRKKAWIKAPASVPSSGRTTAIQKVENVPSPITFDTTRVFLSM